MSNEECLRRLTKGIIEHLCPSIRENLEMAARHASEFLNACCTLSQAVDKAFNRYYLSVLDCNFIVESAVSAALNYVISPLGLGRTCAYPPLKVYWWHLWQGSA